MCTSTVALVDATRAQPEIVIGLVTAAPASGTLTSVALVPVHAVPGGVVGGPVGGLVGGGVGVPPPPTVCTVIVTLAQEFARELSELFSALSAVNPQRVFTAAHSPR